MTIQAAGFPPNEVAADLLRDATAGIGLTKDEAQALSWLTQYPTDAAAAIASVIRKARGLYSAPDAVPAAVVDLDTDGSVLIIVPADGFSDLAVTAGGVFGADMSWTVDEARADAAALLRAAELVDAGYGLVGVSVDGSHWICTECDKPITLEVPCPAHGTRPPVGTGFKLGQSPAGQPSARDGDTATAAVPRAPLSLLGDHHSNLPVAGSPSNPTDADLAPYHEALRSAANALSDELDVPIEILLGADFDNRGGEQA